MLVRSVVGVSVLAAALVAGCGKTTGDTAGSETGEPTGNGGAAGTGTTAGSGGGSATSGRGGGAVQSGTGGLAGLAGGGAPAGVPTLFRITNQTDTTVYVDANLAVRCSDMDPGAVGACQFLPLYCAMSCDGLEPGSDCCMLCEREIPNTLRLDPGQSHELEWDGTLFTTNYDHCAACACQDSGPIPDGLYGAIVTAYPTWTCDGVDPCIQSSAGVIEWAVPSGDPDEFLEVFSIPSSTGVVQIDITAG